MDQMSQVDPPRGGAERIGEAGKAGKAGKAGRVRGPTTLGLYGAWEVEIEPEARESPRLEEIRGLVGFRSRSRAWLYGELAEFRERLLDPVVYSALLRLRECLRARGQSRGGRKTRGGVISWKGLEGEDVVYPLGETGEGLGPFLAGLDPKGLEGEDVVYPFGVTGRSLGGPNSGLSWPLLVCLPLGDRTIGTYVGLGRGGPVESLMRGVLGLARRAARVTRARAAGPDRGLGPGGPPRPRPEVPQSGTRESEASKESGASDEHGRGPGTEADAGAGSSVQDGRPGRFSCADRSEASHSAQARPHPAKVSETSPRKSESESEDS